MAQRPTIRWTTLTLDCTDADEMAGFYSRVLGWQITDRDDGGWVQLRDPDGGVGLNIQGEQAYQSPRWPEQPDQQAKMMHLELLVDDLDAAVELVLDSGGTEASHQPSDRDAGRLRVMLDPAGHPFCLFVRGE